MLSRSIFLLGTCLIVVALAAGCGDGGDGTAADGGGEASSLTKKEFIERADAICDKADKAQEAGLQKVNKETPVAELSKAEQQELVVTLGLGPVKKEAEELAELGAPAGDEEQIEAFISQLEAALAKAERNPKLVSGGGSNPFKEVNELAAEYGFEGCSEVL